MATVIRIDGWSMEDPLRPKEVADLFRVRATTVTRWAEEGRLVCARTPRGTRRYSREQVLHLLNQPGDGGTGS